MVDTEHLCRKVKESPGGPEGVFTVKVDAIAAAHLRLLAEREGIRPEVLAGRMVSQRLHAALDSILGECG